VKGILVISGTTVVMVNAILLLLTGASMYKQVAEADGSNAKPKPAIDMRVLCAQSAQTKKRVYWPFRYYKPTHESST
jgi:hypothetical protein